jgi:anthranilate synthase component 1
MEVEYYSHVMHIVSNVTGTLAPDKDAFDALRATFPAGTVSGAPKVRAMEIIAGLEPAARGPYAGTVGYFGLDGAMDMCITIRTFVLAGGRAYLQSGAGIVADSDPEREYEECLHKARALHRALELAAGMHGDDSVAPRQADRETTASVLGGSRLSAEASRERIGPRSPDQPSGEVAR